MEILTNPMLWEAISRVLWETIAFSCIAILAVGVPVQIMKYAINCDHWVVNGLNKSLMWLASITILMVVIFMIITVGQIMGKQAGF